MITLTQQTKTKADIVNQLSTKIGLSKSDCKKLVEAQFALIGKFLEHHVAVKITGLGKFFILKKNPRVGRNPKTMEEALISGRYVISYRPSPKLNTILAKNSNTLEEMLV